jgi:hypothetical protein
MGIIVSNENDHFHFGYPEYIAPTDLSVANILAHGGQLSFCDYSGREFEIGQVVFFEYNTYYATLPRKGRITKINPNKQKIKVLSDKSGGYEEYREPEVKISVEHRNMFGYRDDSNWREFWIDMSACPIIIGGNMDRICDC